MNTLTLKDAAKFLHIHPVTLQEKARAGEVPGAKVGKCWVFLDVDLVQYLRSKYRQRALQGEHTEGSICHSTNAETRLIGGSNSPMIDAEYGKVLGLPAKRKRGNTTTS